MINLAECTSLAHVEEAVRGLPVTGAGRVRANLRFIEAVAQPESVIELLGSLLDDAERLEAVARRSYRHVNHFDKIVLVDSDPELGHRLTLHLWNPPYSDTDLEEELIHDHRFSFWSAILAGDLVSQNFQRADEGRVYREYRYVAEKRMHTGPMNFYTFIGEVTLRTASVTTHTAGQTYHLASERIHQVMLPRTRLTCTLVLRGPRERGYANVYNTRYPPTDVQTPNRSFSPSELAGKLSGLCEAVGARRG
jgi:hypothetical protein